MKKLRVVVLISAAMACAAIQGKAECGPGHESECKAPEDPIIIIVESHSQIGGRLTIKLLLSAFLAGRRI